MLHTLTHLQLADRATRVRQELATTEKAIAAATLLRDEQMAHLIATFLSELTKKTFRRMTENFPDFLTKQRARAFLANTKFLGFFKPGGHDHVLTLLQAQFRAFLDTCGRFEREDTELARLTRTAAALRGDLGDIERERVARLRAETARTASTKLVEARAVEARRTASPPTRAPQREIVREALDVAPDDGVLPFIVAVAQSESRASCPPPVIATDDRLGCFS